MVGLPSRHSSHCSCTPTALVGLYSTQATCILGAGCHPCTVSMLVLLDEYIYVLLDKYIYASVLMPKETAASHKSAADPLSSVIWLADDEANHPASIPPPPSHCAIEACKTSHCGFLPLLPHTTQVPRKYFYGLLYLTGQGVPSHKSFIITLTSHTLKPQPTTRQMIVASTPS